MIPQKRKKTWKQQWSGGSNQEFYINHSELWFVNSSSQQTLHHVHNEQQVVKGRKRYSLSSLWLSEVILTKINCHTEMTSLKPFIRFSNQSLLYFHVLRALPNWQLFKISQWTPFVNVHTILEAFHWRHKRMSENTTAIK